MRTLLYLFVLAGFFLACEKKMAEKEISAETLALPMEVSYKGTPRIGNMKNVQTVMEWNKRMSALNLDVGDLLADTITWHLADGLEITAPRDSALAFLAQYAEGLSKIDVIYTAAIPVNMVGPDDEWVFSWTDETYTAKDGKVEHSFLHEDYLMEGGKIREVFQYARKRPQKELAE